MKATLAIEFDTTIKKDTTKLEQIANIINDKNSSFSNASFSSGSAYEDMTKKIADLKNENNDLKIKIKQLNVQISEKDNTYEELIKEEQRKYSKLEQDSTNDLNKKSKEIQELKKKLEHYEPGGFNDGEEKFYYNEQNNRLTETRDDKAPYIAQAIDKNKCRFHFNTDSGPIKEACSSNRDLLMYCDIINEEPNANNIMRDEWGIASLTDSGDLIVESNAKIKLTRI